MGKHLENMRDRCAKLERMMMGTMEGISSRVAELEENTHDSLARLARMSARRDGDAASVGDMSSGAWNRVFAHINAQNDQKDFVAQQGVQIESPKPPSPGWKKVRATASTAATISKARGTKDRFLAVMDLLLPSCMCVCAYACV